MKLDKGHAILLGLCVLFIILLIIIGVYAKGKHDLVVDMQAQDSLDSMKFKELEQGLARAESQLVSERELRQELKEVFNVQFDTVLSDLAELKAKPNTVIHTTTVVEGDTNVIEDTDFPPSYKFRTQEGMSVAQYLYENRQFRAETFDLTVDTGIVISEDKHGNRVAHVRGSISSSDPEDDGVYPLEIVNSELSFVKPNKLEMMWAPHVMIGASGGYSITHHKGRPSAAVMGNFFAIGATTNDNILRLPCLRASFNTTGIGIGIDPVALNIATPLPLVSDIWLSIGPTFSSDGNSIDLTVSSTF